jgi:probable addiction module antidote protein
MKDRDHDEAIAELFAQDPGFAVTYVNEVLKEGDQADLLIALRQLTSAFGGIARVAETAKLNPTQLYRTLSAEGNPELRSLSAILKVMGLRLAVQPVAPAQRHSRH